MSQKATRKSQNAAVADEKEKESPVKEMKKKIAANAEKDKLAAEKADKAEKNEPAEKNKSNEKADKNAEKSDKKVDKPDKNAEKSDKKADKPDKNAEKSDKTADKLDKNADKPDKNADKSEKTVEKKSDKSEKVADKKSDKSAEKKEDKTAEKKSEPEKDESKGDKSKDKGPRAMNGHNGAANGCEAGGSDGSDAELVIEEDEAFPELAYEDSGSDAEDAPRSRTRRGQVKATKTPETPAPRPASGRDSEESKESKLLKLNEPVAPSDRKLRSADSPKPEPKKVDKKQDTEEEKKATKKDLETSKKDQESKSETKKADDAEKSQPIDVDEVSEKMDVEVVVVESTEGCAPRTRARVSPYSRPRLDRTHTSAMADYTGNNSTMEMDITESSAAEEPSLDESGYLRGLRGIRGRASYKLLRDIQLTRPRAPDRAAAGPARPLGAVVGRKRKPSAEAPPEPAEEADLFLAHGKRMRLLDRLAQPFRRTLARRAAEIVGINTDLPLTAPIASTSFAAFDPETLKPAPAPGAPPPAPDEPVATPLDLPADRDGKRCVIM